MAAADTPKSEWPVIQRAEVEAFVSRCVQAVGVSKEHGDSLAEILAMADNRGHYSHGLNRLDNYVKDVEKGNVALSGEPEIIQDKAATAWVDGKNLVGPVVGTFCMDLAIQKARQAGIGWVVAKASNHFGIGGWYIMRAQEQGLVGMCFTNTSPSMVPTRARKAALGTNPICCAAPGVDGDSFVLDMATTTAARGKLEVARKKGASVPNSWGCDETGKQSNDPNEILKVGSGTLFPLGGTEECGGYKGYGLSMMVEIFCGIFGGSNFANNVRKWGDHDAVANLGQCFVAIDPSAFAPGFESRMSEMMNMARDLPTAAGYDQVMVPGDPEREHLSMCDTRGGIPYHPGQVELAEKLAQRLNVKPMPVLAKGTA